MKPDELFRVTVRKPGLDDKEFFVVASNLATALEKAIIKRWVDGATVEVRSLGFVEDVLCENWPRSSPNLIGGFLGHDRQEVTALKDESLKARYRREMKQLRGILFPSTVYPRVEVSGERVDRRFMANVLAFAAIETERRGFLPDEDKRIWDEWEERWRGAIERGGTMAVDSRGARGGP
jgi:hypothetical protein